MQVLRRDKQGNIAKIREYDTEKRKDQEKLQLEMEK